MAFRVYPRVSLPLFDSCIEPGTLSQSSGAHSVRPCRSTPIIKAKSPSRLSSACNISEWPVLGPPNEQRPPVAPSLRLRSSERWNPPSLVSQVHCADSGLELHIDQILLGVLSDAIIERAVSSFFTPASQKKPEQITWRVVNNSAIIGKYVAEAERKQTAEKPKVAAFDLVRVVRLDSVHNEGTLSPC